MTAAPFRVAIAGLGTVGGSVVQLLKDNAGLLAHRAGRPIVVSDVSARDKSKARKLPLGDAAWWGDAQAMADNAAVDCFVEGIGGSDDPSLSIARAVLERGVPFVTSNKALLATHGLELAETAERKGVALLFEAAVAGGIPALTGIREGLSGNVISSVCGILNGTCNYILTEMSATGRAFDEVLKEAQDLGYAEADPAFDIEGTDASHKLALLAALAFGCGIDIGSVHVEGITQISAHDIRFARELGYRIKLLGIARRSEHGIELRVHPCMVPAHSVVAEVNGPLNAVIAEGDYSGRVVWVGRGAGGRPTASAVVSDIVSIARGAHGLPFGAPVKSLEALRAAPIGRREGKYYLRLMVMDRPGVIADVAAALRDFGVSLESVIQRGRDPEQIVPVVFTTHDTREDHMRKALQRIGKLESVTESCLIRIEEL